MLQPEVMCGGNVTILRLTDVPMHSIALQSVLFGQRDMLKLAHVARKVHSNRTRCLSECCVIECCFKKGG